MRFSTSHNTPINPSWRRTRHIPYWLRLQQTLLIRLGVGGRQCWALPNNNQPIKGLFPLLAVTYNPPFLSCLFAYPNVACTFRCDEIFHQPQCTNQFIVDKAFMLACSQSIYARIWAFKTPADSQISVVPCSPLKFQSCQM